MQATDPHSSGLTLVGAGGVERLRERLEELGREIGKAEHEVLRTILADAERSPESTRDAVSTRLMEIFRASKSRACFGLLYELNGQHLLLQVSSRLRRYGSKADPRDVLQEVFFNVYRYPHRFDCTREDAFRVWSAMIVRNTVLKHLRSQARGGRAEIAFDDLPEQPETVTHSPLGGAIENESRNECVRVYTTYLQLYLRFYKMLSERERRALHLVEVEELSYRQAASELDIKLENLKMVIFRARRKIHRSMRRIFEGLPPDCRPAREPKKLRGERPKPERTRAGSAEQEGTDQEGTDDAGELEGEVLARHGTGIAGTGIAGTGIDDTDTDEGHASPGEGA